MRLDDAKGFVLDVDGTLVHRAGEDVHVQPGARELLERIRASGRPLAIFTNGSHLAPEGFAAGLRAAGLDIADEEMLTPLRSVQSYLHAQRREGPVLLFGTDAAREYLIRCGVNVLDGTGDPRIDRSSSHTPTEWTSPSSSARHARCSRARRSSQAATRPPTPEPTGRS